MLGLKLNHVSKRGHLGAYGFVNNGAFDKDRLIASFAKLLYRVSGIGSQKCLHPVTYHFLTL